MNRSVLWIAPIQVISLTVSGMSVTASKLSTEGMVVVSVVNEVSGRSQDLIF